MQENGNSVKFKKYNYVIIYGHNVDYYNQIKITGHSLIHHLHCIYIHKLNLFKIWSSANIEKSNIDFWWTTSQKLQNATFSTINFRNNWVSKVTQAPLNACNIFHNIHVMTRRKWWTNMFTAQMKTNMWKISFSVS